MLYLVENFLYPFLGYGLFPELLLKWFPAN